MRRPERSAADDAAGVDAVLAADPVTDWGNPNVVRGSKGTVFSVPVAAYAKAIPARKINDETIETMT